MVAMPSDSPSSSEDTVVYRSKDRRFTLIVDRKRRENEPADGGSWMAVRTSERQRILEFLTSLEASGGKIEISSQTRRVATIVENLESLRAVMEELDSQRDEKWTSRQAVSHLTIGLALALVFASCALLVSGTALLLSVPFYFAAAIAAFAAVMTYVARRVGSEHSPRWVRWLNSVRECLANESQIARSAW